MKMTSRKMALIGLIVVTTSVLLGCSDIPMYTSDEMVGLALQEARLAKKYEIKKEYDKAFEHYNRSLTISERPSVHCDLAEMFSDTGRFEEAQEHYFQALSMSPDYRRAQRGLEQLGAKKKLLALGKTREEIDAAMKRWESEAISPVEPGQAGPDSNETYREYLIRQGIPVDEVNVKLYERGIELAKAGRNDQAIRMFREVILDSPNDARVYYNLGNLYYQTDDLRRAMMEFKTATELDPRFSAAFNNLAIVQEALGYSGEARKNYIKAIAVGNYEQAHYNLAVLCNKLGEVDNAIAEYETYLELAPEGAFAESAKYQLKKLYRIR